MKNFISKGTGNSRYLKSVSDFLTKYPTYADFAAALIAGNFPVDFNGFNPNGIQQAGMPLDEEHLMPTTLAAALGLTGDASVADALGALHGLVGAVPLKFIKNGTLTADAASVNIDLSGIDLSQYKALKVLFYPIAPADNRSVFATLNNINLTNAYKYKYVSGSGSNNYTSMIYTGASATTDKRVCVSLLINIAVEELSGYCFGMGCSDLYYYDNTGLINGNLNVFTADKQKVTASSLTNIQLTLSGDNLKAGTSYTLYGLKG